MKSLLPFALMALVAVVAFYAFPYNLAFLTRVVITMILVLSLDLLIGVTGIDTLGQAALYGTGAYAAGLFAVHVWADPVAGPLVGGLAGAGGVWAPARALAGAVRTADALGASAHSWDDAVVEAVRAVRKEAPKPLALEVVRLWADLDARGAIRTYRASVKVACRVGLVRPSSGPRADLARGGPARSAQVLDLVQGLGLRAWGTVECSGQAGGYPEAARTLRMTRSSALPRTLTVFASTFTSVASTPSTGSSASPMAAISSLRSPV